MNMFSPLSFTELSMRRDAAARCAARTAIDGGPNLEIFLQFFTAYDTAWEAR